MVQVTAHPCDTQAAGGGLSGWLELLRFVLGVNAVLVDAQVAESRDPCSPKESGWVPRVVLQPRTVEQVQEVVRIA